MSTELVVLVPSRSRPQNIDRLLKAWTFYHATSDLMIYVDEDDPEVDEYRKLPDHPYASLTIGPRSRPQWHAQLAGLAGVRTCTRTSASWATTIVRTPTGGTRRSSGS